MNTSRARRTVAAALLAALALAGGSCAEGDDEAPGRVSDLHFFFRADALIFNGRVSEGDTLGSPDTRLLAWTAPGDDDFDGEAALYDVRYFLGSDLLELGVTSAATAFGSYWGRAHQLLKEPYPREAGRLEQWFLPRIDPGETVWMALRTYDEIGLESKLSAVAGPFRMKRLMIPIRPGAGTPQADFGASLAAARDVNRDGYQDLVLGFPGQGKVCLVLGASNNTIIRPRPNINSIYVLSAIPELLPALTITGASSDGFGAAVAGISLLNADDYSDLAVGAPGVDDGATADAGAVFIKYGAAAVPAALSADSVEIRLVGEAAGDRFGTAVAPAFDPDFDGDNEFIVGALNAHTAGAAYLFKGAGLVSGSAAQALVLIKGESPGDSLGQAVAAVGDVNGDGIMDFAVSAPGADGPGAETEAGAVYVFYGGDAGVIGFSGLGPAGRIIDLAAESADVTIRGTAPGRRFGKALTAGGDLAGNADGAFDFAVSGGDTVYIFFGGPGGILVTNDIGASVQLGGPAGEEFGAALAGPGDLNRDGADDLVVGAPAADAVYIYYGRFTALGASRMDSIPNPGAPTVRFGAALAGPGDLNLDGYVDLLIGAPPAGEAYYVF